MPTILELFENSQNIPKVKQEDETFLEQETTGIRVDSLVELNNPLFYGNEAVRIGNRSTPSVEAMKDSLGGTPPQRGLIDRAISGVTGGRVDGLRDIRDTVNSTLGIPSTLIPTEVGNDYTFELSAPYNHPTEIARLMNDQSGGILGNLLQNSGGTPKTIGKQVAGNAIGKLKNELRNQLFTDTSTVSPLQPQLDPNDKWYSPTHYYTSIVRIGDERDGVSQRFTSTITVNPPDENRTNNQPVSLTDLSPQFGADTLSSVNSKVDTPRDKGNNDYKSEFLPNGTIYSSTIERPDSSDSVKERFVKETPAGELDIDTNSITLDDVSPAYNISLDTYTFNGTYQDIGKSVGDIKGKKTLDERGFLSNTDSIDNTEVSSDYSNNEDNLVPFWVSDLDGSRGVTFRAFLSSISDTIAPEWSSGKFVGNPYSYHTYTGIERTISFSLSIFPHSQTGLENSWKKISYFSKKLYPTIDVEQQFVNPNFIRFRLGDMYNNRIALIESWTLNIDDNAPWETEVEGLRLPKYITLEASLKLVETVGSEEKIYDHK